MKRVSTIFLQVVLVLIGLSAVTILIEFPLVEGRAVDLDLVSIYTDPFILYAYATSVAFFVALYKAFRLLGFIRTNKVFSAPAVKALRSIKFCAITISAAIALSGIYMMLFHDKADDAAGFVALSIITTFASIVIATAAAVFQQLLQKAIDMKSENELTI